MDRTHPMGGKEPGRWPTPHGYVGVVGPSRPSADQEQVARVVGALLAQAGVVVVTGGHGGVMAAASQGAQEAGGLTLGVLPGLDRRDENRYLTVSLPTGLGELRNGLLVRACAALIAVGGSWGTLSEIALAVRTGVPTYVLDGWQVTEPGGSVIAAPVRVGSAAEAVRQALTHLPAL